MDFLTLENALWLVLAVIIFLIIKELFNKPPPPRPVAVLPAKEPLKQRDFTPEELLAFDGKDPDRKGILVALNGNVYDLTPNAKMYTSGSYAVFLGH
eukprot:CAMPEP_0184342766 /NCGR_PEP_ID=MMETSP1089-20130417/11341_1 /TAXON_ID=38269 ORGANISM="Gloeochaete wittrockiana, Strain SAG46.84" /NCGR_SAMPLE_ID=MMETSP1089 /ASSEMBLY_ACC=CAM_ASM_000445 /LENGTH=96 /DNA_ID=CAMNT_0026671765 /DNA_START=143 /DNA_END=430 /DNA_ORIENTATION=-